MYISTEDINNEDINDMLLDIECISMQWRASMNICRVDKQLFEILVKKSTTEVLCFMQQENCQQMRFDVSSERARERTSESKREHAGESACTRERERVHAGESARERV